MPALGGWHEWTGCQILESDQACRPTHCSERGPSISFRASGSFLPPAMARECCVVKSASGVGTGRGRRVQALHHWLEWGCVLQPMCLVLTAGVGCVPFPKWCAWHVCVYLLAHFTWIIQWVEESLAQSQGIRWAEYIPRLGRDSASPGALMNPRGRAGVLLVQSSLRRQLCFLSHFTALTKEPWILNKDHKRSFLQNCADQVYTCRP